MLERLKLLREREGISQKQLAERIGVSQQSINKYENHSVEPDIETLIRMADLFNTSVDYLIGHSDVDHRAEPVAPTDLNGDELRWLVTWRRLTPRQRDALAGVAKAFRDK